MKIMTVVGTRPEIIRLSRVIVLLDESVDHVLVHTGQNYDYLLNEVFFENLGMRPPDHYLNVRTTSLGETLGDILIKSEELMRRERPDAVLILGDTNSSIAALIAKRLNIPVYHMEAGNRCFDENVPEETNRRMVDHISDFNLVYTEHARRNLLREGLHPRHIQLTGSPMREVLNHNLKSIKNSDIVDRLNLTHGRYFLVSVHRQENVDSEARLEQLIACLNAIASEWSYPVVVSTHPRTRKRLEAVPHLSISDLIQFMPPFGFHEYNKLQLDAACVLSDSGTISEESALLSFAAVTLRDSIERPEALDAGSIMLTGLSPRDTVRNVAVAMRMTQDREPPQLPDGYEVTDVSRRVLTFILSTQGRHAQWLGLHS